MEIGYRPMTITESIAYKPLTKGTWYHIRDESGYCYRFKQIKTLNKFVTAQRLTGYDPIDFYQTITKGIK